MPPHKMNIFCCYFAVVLLFGWLNLVDSVSNSSKLKNNKKTFAGEGDCRTTEIDRYLIKMEASVKRVSTEISISGFELSNYPYHIKRLLKESLLLMPKIAPFLLPFNSQKQDNKPMECRSQMSEKINKSFDNLKEAVKNVNKEFVSIYRIYALLRKKERVLNLRRSFDAYNNKIRVEILLFTNAIQKILNPKIRSDTGYNALKKRCTLSTIGPGRLLHTFASLLVYSCEQKTQKRYSSNVKNFRLTLTNHTKIFGNAKYSNSKSDCLPILIQDLTIGNWTHVFFKRFILDSIYMIQIMTYCGGIVFAEKLNYISRVKEYVEQLDFILFSLDNVYNIILKTDTLQIKQVEKEFGEKLSDIYSSIENPKKNPNFWIEDVKEEIEDLCSILMPGYLLFVDGTANVSITICPVRQCFFLENFEGMHVMYFKALKKEMNYYPNEVKLIGNVSFYIGEANNMINKTNSNLSDIVDEFIYFDPFYHSLNNVQSAAIFYKNESGVKLAFVGPRIHPYAHHNIITNSGDIQFFASSGYWFNQTDYLQDNCDITIDWF
jgi:hypothetical protein